MPAKHSVSRKELAIQMSGRFASVADIAEETGLRPATVKAIRSRHKDEIGALQAESRESLDQIMRDELLLTSAVLMRNLKRRAELMPEDTPLDSRTAIQLLKLSAAYTMEKPSQKTQSTHLHITLEQLRRAEETAAVVELDWKRPQGAIEARAEEAESIAGAGGPWSCHTKG